MPRTGKKQKGFQLPEDVILWLEYLESTTGASFSRVALAAFCSLLSSDEHYEELMTAAMAVEKGEWEFVDVPWRILGLDARRVGIDLERAKSEFQRKDLQEELDRLGGWIARKREESAMLARCVVGWSRMREGSLPNAGQPVVSERIGLVGMREGSLPNAGQPQVDDERPPDLGQSADTPQAKQEAPSMSPAASGRPEAPRPPESKQPTRADRLAKRPGGRKRRKTRSF